MLNIDNDAIPCIIQTMQVSFLEEKWEFEAYALALYRATKWGKKIDKQNKDYFSKNHLIDKYNV